MTENPEKILQINKEKLQREKFPGTLGQAMNFLDSMVRVRSGKEYVTKGLQRFVLEGLSTLMPEVVRDSGILKNPTRLRAVDELLAFLITFNDRIDFAYLPSELQALKDGAADAEEAARHKLETSLEELNASELETVIKNALAETEAIEKYVQDNKGKLSFDEIEMYRNIINAILNASVTAVILNSKELIDRLPTLSDTELNWESIRTKYNWVINAQPQNIIEKAIVVMHMIGMAMQVDDDWYGRNIDMAIGIQSMATAALEETHDPHLAKEMLDSMKVSYLANARKQGLNPVSVVIINHAQKAVQRYQSWAAQKARYPIGRLLLRNRVSKFGLREQLYADKAF